MEIDIAKNEGNTNKSITKVGTIESNVQIGNKSGSKDISITTGNIGNSTQIVSLDGSSSVNSGGHRSAIENVTTGDIRIGSINKSQYIINANNAGRVTSDVYYRGY